MHVVVEALWRDPLWLRHVLWGEPELSEDETDASEDEEPTAPKKSDSKTRRPLPVRRCIPITTIFIQKSWSINK